MPKRHASLLFFTSRQAFDSAIRSIFRVHPSCFLRPDRDVTHAVHITPYKRSAVR